MSGVVHVSSNGEGYLVITSESGERQVAEEILHRSSVLRDSLLATNDGQVSVTVPEAETVAWLEAVSMLQLGTSDSNLDGLHSSQLACYVQACDFLGDVAAVRALCKILGATLFPEPAADGNTVENNSITEVFQELNSPELIIAVLCATGRSLSCLVATIPAAFHRAAVHATFPSISLQASLDLDVGAHTTAAASVALEVFAAASAPRCLQLSNFLLNPAPACEALQGANAAELHGPPGERSAAAQLVPGASYTAPHASSSSCTPRMRPPLQRFVAALRRALECSTLQELSLTNITFVGSDIALHVLAEVSLSPQLHRLQFSSVSCVDASFADATLITPFSTLLSQCSALQSLCIGWDVGSSPDPHDTQMPSCLRPHFCSTPCFQRLSARHQRMPFEAWLGHCTHLTELCLSDVPAQQSAPSVASFLSMLVGLQSLVITVDASHEPTLGEDTPCTLSSAVCCLTALTRLTIHSHQCIRGGPPLNIAAALRATTLKRLDLRNWALGSDSIDALSAALKGPLVGLEALAIVVTNMDTRTLSLLHALQGLSRCTEYKFSSFYMSMSGAVDVAFADALCRFTQLQHLTLTHVNLVEHPEIVNPQVLVHAPTAVEHREAVLSALSELTSLELSASFDRDVEGRNVLAGLRPLSKLRSLKICGTLLLDESMRNLSDGLSHLSSLESLSLKALECSAAGAAFFSECLPELVSLTYLALVCTFSYEPDIGMAVACTHLSRVSRLACLALDKNMLGPESCRVLASGLPMLSDLKSVSMHHCGFLFDGLSDLTRGLAMLTCLECLCLTDSMAQANNVLLIAAALEGMTNLCKVSLGKFALDDVGLEALTRAFSRMPKLSDVDFGASDVSGEACRVGPSDVGWGHVGTWLTSAASVRRCSLCKYEGLVEASAGQVFQALSDEDPLRLSELLASYRAAHSSVAKRSGEEFRDGAVLPAPSFE